jgi:misacylated tRNA(Ala) deacylase
MSDEATDLLYYTDAYRREFDSAIVAVDTERNAVALAETGFFPTGGGQPHDTGELSPDGTPARVVDVRKDGAVVWHTLAADAPLPEVGTVVRGTIDWPRRYLIMRLHHGSAHLERRYLARLRRARHGSADNAA